MTTPQEYDDLVKWLQSMAEYNPDYSPICEKSIAAITALRAERDAAVEALMPFGELAKYCMGLPENNSCAYSVKVGDLRRAASLASRKEEV